MEDIVLLGTAAIVCSVLLWWKNRRGRQKKQRTAVIASLASDYDLVAYLDVEKSKVTLFQVCEIFRKVFDGIDHSLPSNLQLDEFFKAVIVPKDFNQFLINVNPKNIIEVLSTQPSYTVRFRIFVHDEPCYYQIKLTYDKRRRNCYVIGMRNIDYEVRREQENKELKESLKETTLVAYKDALTGVGNASALTYRFDELDKAIASGTATSFAIIECDLNRLKQVNDSLGHDAGNTYIKNNCKVFCDVFKHSPVYRAGGDEFVILLFGEDYTQRHELFQKLQSRSTLWKQADCNCISFAAGMSDFDPKYDTSVRSVINRADEQMYGNKEQGKASA